MFTQHSEITEFFSETSFQTISNKSIECAVISSQLMTGSKIAKCSYKQVVFSECTFNSCEFQGVIFENCVFENCSFEFSHIRSSSFNNCNFSNCTWRASSSTKSIYIDCHMDSLSKHIGHDSNIISTEAKDHTTDIYIELMPLAA